MKASLLLASFSAALFAAFAPNVAMAQAAPVVVFIENGICRAAMAAERADPYSDGGPWASISSNCGRQAQEGEPSSFASAHGKKLASRASCFLWLNAKQPHQTRTVKPKSPRI